jgi:hypothetical protein
MRDPEILQNLGDLHGDADYIWKLHLNVLSISFDFGVPAVDLIIVSRSSHRAASRSCNSRSERSGPWRIRIPARAISIAVRFRL